MSTSWIPFDLFHAVDSTLDYDYMHAINEFVSNEEKGEICNDPSLPSPSSLVPETSQSSDGMVHHSPTKESSAMRHLEAKELQHSLVSLESESPIESESESLTAQSIPGISRIQSNYSSPMSALGLSFEPDHLFHAGNKPQRSSVRSAHTKNMEIIRASLGRSNLDFDEGVERRTLSSSIFTLRKPIFLFLKLLQGIYAMLRSSVYGSRILSIN